MNKQRNYLIYNKAISAISMRDYESARQLLLEATLHLPDEVNFQTVLCNLELLLGYPHLALERVTKYNLLEQHISRDKVEWAQAHLAQYDAVYERYHYGLQLLQRRNFKEAHSEFTQLITESSQINLPLPIYKGYIFLSLLEGMYEDTWSFIDQAPVYVKNSQEVIHVKAQIINELSKKEVDKKLIKDRQRSSSKWRKVLLTSAASLVVIAGTVMATFLFTQQKAVPVIVKEDAKLKQTLHEKTEGLQVKEVAKKLEEQVDVLTKQLEETAHSRHEYMKQLANTQQQLATYETMLEAVDISSEELKHKAAKGLYNKGYRYYQSGDYEQAIQAFSTSASYEVTSYFSDDNLYYWALSLINVGGDDEAVLIYDSFITNQDHNYTQSPLLSPILFYKAEYYLKQENIGEAKTLLSRILEEHPEEWAAEKARSLMITIEKGERM